ncbi:MAG: Fic family protein [Bifidobacteriaceae bacterium]|jgi:Fic family protein|nr:Fic family protein [Bifidobacteriaceae bacterium]
MMAYVPFRAFADWQVPFGASVVDQYAEHLGEVRAAATEDERAQALEVAIRSAAVDTGALEGLYTTDRGFTKTVATRSGEWREALAMKGEQPRRSIEDQLEGYEFVLDTAASSEPISQSWIRELHAILTKRQETHREEQRALPHGEYKTHPNNPTSSSTGRVHHYAPPESTHPEMTRLVDQLRSPEFDAAHPVVQAAYAHYAFVSVHPFADGNGRVARALASLYLYRNPGVPLVIFADQRDRYVDGLEAADSGGPDEFVQFISERVIDAIGVMESALTPVRRPDTSLIDAAVGEGNRRDEPGRVAARAAARVRAACEKRLEVAIRGYELPRGLGWRVGMGPGVGVPDGYAASGGVFAARADTWDAPTGKSRIEQAYQVGLAESPDGGPEIAVFADGDLEPLRIWRREIDPSETEAFRLKVEDWAERAAARFVQALTEAVANGALD